MNAKNISKIVAVSECLLIALLLQCARIGLQHLISLCNPSLSDKMLTMTGMVILWFPLIAFIRIRRVRFTVFPRPFTRGYIIVTLIAAALLVSAPSNYSGGYNAVLGQLYGCIITPVFEETVFRGYMWERIKTSFDSEKTAYALTAVFFTLWHIGYMFGAGLFATLTKLIAALGYGVIVGFARYKSKNLYLPSLVHGVMNLFMI